MPKLFFGHVGQLLNKRAKLNFKIYEVINWPTNNYNIYIFSNISKSKMNPKIKSGQLIEYNMRNTFL